MRNIIRHPFFNLKCDVEVTILAPPSFVDIAQRLESVDVIDRKILDNLATLFRGVPLEEIITRLICREKTWEKAFYHLLKAYHERQSEEYGDGMSFTEFSGNEERVYLSNPKRLSREQKTVGPTGTVRGGLIDTHLRKVPDSGANKSRRHNSDIEESSRLKRSSVIVGATDRPPIATRAAPTPIAPAPPPRHRARPVAGPRPQSISKGPNSPLIPPSSPYPAPTSPLATAPVRIGLPFRPNSPDLKKSEATPVVTRSEAVGVSSPTKICQPEKSVQSSPLPIIPVVLHGPVPSSPRPLPSIVVSSLSTAPRQLSHPVPSPKTRELPLSPPQRSSIDQRLLEQRLRNANVMGMTPPQLPSDNVPIIGLGLTFDTAPRSTTPLIDTIRPSSQHQSHEGSALSSKVETLSLYTSPALLPLPNSPLLTSSLEKLPSLSNVPEEPTPAHSSQITSLGKLPPTICASPIPIFNRGESSGTTPNIEGFPFPTIVSKPDSQPSSENRSSRPLSLLQESSVFTDRFSLHLDAMLPAFKASLPTHHSEKTEEVEGEDEEAGAGVNSETPGIRLVSRLARTSIVEEVGEPRPASPSLIRETLPSAERHLDAPVAANRRSYPYHSERTSRHVHLEAVSPKVAEPLHRRSEKENTPPGKISSSHQGSGGRISTMDGPVPLATRKNRRESYCSLNA